MGYLALTASGDNQSNGFSLDKLSSTKYPLYLVLMEVAEQLRRRRVLLHLSWRPRDENIEADALTNDEFGGFDSRLRVEVEWDKLGFLVLPRLTEMAEEYFEGVHAVKRAAKAKGHVNKALKVKRARLRETDPW